MVYRCQNDTWLYAVLFISIDRMPFLAQTLDDADRLFALVITLGFYLHHIEVADQDPARRAVVKTLRIK